MFISVHHAPPRGAVPRSRPSQSRETAGAGWAPSSAVPSAGHLSLMPQVSHSVGPHSPLKRRALCPLRDVGLLVQLCGGLHHLRNSAGPSSSASVRALRSFLSNLQRPLGMCISRIEISSLPCRRTPQSPHTSQYIPTCCITSLCNPAPLRQFLYSESRCLHFHAPNSRCDANQYKSSHKIRDVNQMFIHQFAG